MISNDNKQVISFGWSPALTAAFLVVFIWSGISPTDFSIWLAEAIALPVAIAVWTIFAGPAFVLKPSLIVQLLVVIMFSLHMIGGHFTYSAVPFFEDTLPYYLHFTRNHYDRVAHFLQGVVLAIIAREYFVEAMNLRGTKTLIVLCVIVVLAFANLCEQYEWIVVEVIKGQHGIEYLGSQGDDFDTQKDMFMSFLGSFFSLFCFSALQDRQLLKCKK